MNRMRQALKYWKYGQETFYNYLGCLPSEDFKKLHEEIERSIIQGRPFTLGVLSLLQKPYDIVTLQKMCTVVELKIHERNKWIFNSIQEKLEKVLPVIKTGINEGFLSIEDNAKINASLSSAYDCAKHYDVVLANRINKRNQLDVTNMGEES